MSHQAKHPLKANEIISTFSVLPNLRRQDVSRFFAKLVLLGFATIIVTRIVQGRPLVPVSITSMMFSVILPVALCLGRVSWGTSLKFQQDYLEIFRGNKLIKKIQRNAILSIQYKASYMSVRYEDERASKVKLITKEGFTDADWESLITCMQLYSPNLAA